MAVDSVQMIQKLCGLVTQHRFDVLVHIKIELDSNVHKTWAHLTGSSCGKQKI